MTLSRDTRLLATGSNSGEVVLWDLSRLRYIRDQLTDEACVNARCWLDQAERTRHVGPDFVYQEDCKSA